jgi:hypothetical protein
MSLAADREKLQPADKPTLYKQIRLVIERHTWRIARPLTAVRLVYPGESHKLVARFKGN